MNFVDNIVVTLKMGGFLKVGVYRNSRKFNILIIPHNFHISEAVESHKLVEHLTLCTVKYVFIGIIHIGIVTGNKGGAVNVLSVG